MKHLEKIVEALKSLTERYGITITEVPERLREKILAVTGMECESELDVVMKPLLSNFLRPLRVRAGNRVTTKVVAEAIKNTAGCEGFTPGLAQTIVDVWVAVYKVKPVKTLIEGQHFDEFDRLAQQLDIKESSKLVTDDSVEKVFNPFDSTTPVPEPQVADYDGNFGDLSFEKVADFEISDAENLVTHDIESFDAEHHADSGRNAPIQSGDKKDKSGKNKKGKSLSSLSVASAVPSPAAEKEKSAANTTTSKHTIDDAFKQLRNNNFDFASKIMMELARNGNTKAQFHLGEFYLMGTGVELSEDKAKYWFRKAAATGSVQAKQKLEGMENDSGSSGCLGCFFVMLVVGGALKLLSMISGL